MPETRTILERSGGIHRYSRNYAERDTVLSRLWTRIDLGPTNTLVLTKACVALKRNNKTPDDLVHEWTETGRGGTHETLCALFSDDIDDVQDDDYFLGGLGRSGTKLFNWHPVLMVAGVIVAYTEGMRIVCSSSTRAVQHISHTLLHRSHSCMC